MLPATYHMAPSRGSESTARLLGCRVRSLSESQLDDIRRSSSKDALEPIARIGSRSSWSAASCTSAPDDSEAVPPEGYDIDDDFKDQPSTGGPSSRDHESTNYDLNTSDASVAPPRSSSSVGPAVSVPLAKTSTLDELSLSRRNSGTSFLSLTKMRLGQVVVSTNLRPYTMPQEALTFEPSANDIKSDGVRYIFLNTPLTQTEQRTLAALKSHLASMGCLEDSGTATDGTTGNAGRGEVERFPDTPTRSRRMVGVAHRNKRLDKAEQQAESGRRDTVVVSRSGTACASVMMPSSSTSSSSIRVRHEWASGQDILYLRYLYSSRFDVKEAADCLWANYMFRLRELPVYEHQVALDLAAGAVYWHGRDKNLRPLLVIRLSRFDQMKHDVSRVQKVLKFSFEFFLRYLSVAGRVENWIILVDCEGCGVVNFPTAAIKNVLHTLNTKYRSRLFQLLIINFPKWLGWLSSWVLSLVPSTSLQKVHFLASGAERHLLTLFAPHQLEAKYGGTAPSLESNFYPFHFFPGPFEPNTSGGDFRAMTDLHTVISDDIIAGASWSLPPTVCAALAQEGRVVGDQLTGVPWIRDLYKQSLTHRSASWLRKKFGIKVAPVMSICEVLAKCETEPE